MNQLTIQINNLEALERLIGGDSQVEIDIRNSVASRFANKHLKPLLNNTGNILSEIRAETLKHAQDELEKGIATFKTYWNGGGIYSIALKPEIKQEIDSAVYKSIQNVINNAVSEGLKKWASDDVIERMIDKRIGQLSEDIIRARINEKLDKLKQ